MTETLAVTLREFLSERAVPEGILSLVLVGSYAKLTMCPLSDVDVVVVGRNDNRPYDIDVIRVFLVGCFSSIFGKRPIVFAEPSFERRVFLDSDSVTSPLLHIIYHPKYRLDKYVDDRNPVVVSWARKYEQLLGPDMLSGVPLEPTITPRQRLDAVDDLIQTLENACIVSDPEVSCLFFAKTLRSVAGRLKQQVELWPQAPQTEIRSMLLLLASDVMRESLEGGKDASWIVARLEDLSTHLLRLRALIAEETVP